MSIPSIRTLEYLRAITSRWRKASETGAVVLTMDALHWGHLSLVRAMLDAGARLIETLFATPEQFSNPEDLANYPRTQHDDAAKLAPLRADILYAPNAERRTLRTLRKSIRRGSRPTSQSPACPTACAAPIAPDISTGCPPW